MQSSALNLFGAVAVKCTVNEKYMRDGGLKGIRPTGPATAQIPLKFDGIAAAPKTSGSCH
jgi:hypothetical protein